MLQPICLKNRRGYIVGENNGPTVPPPPRNVSATLTGNGFSAEITWDPPVAPVDPPIFKYIVSYLSVAVDISADNILSVVFDELSPETTYVFGVRAVNLVGSSSRRLSNAVTTGSVPEIQSGSLFFSGSHLFPTVTPPSSWVATNDFTLECWFQWSATNVQFPMLCSSLVDDSGSPVNTFQLLIDCSSERPNVICIAGLILGNTIVTNTLWHHVAVVRNNNTLALYVDGILENTQTFTNAISFNSGFCLGSSRFATGITNYYGYLSNFRLVIGTAVYNGASFSVPTSPLTAISGTQLLMNTTFDENFLVDSSPNQIEFTMVDSVVSSSKNPFYVPIPPPPTNLFASNISTNFFRINFTQTGEVTNYRYSLNNGSTFTTLNPPSIVSPIIITGLSPNTIYQVVLQAINETVNSASSNTLTVTTRSVSEIQSGSLFFSGSHLFPTVTPPSSWVATNDFTLECWFQWSTTNVQFPMLCSFFITGGTFEILIDSSFYRPNVICLGGAPTILGNTIVTNTLWHHVAVVRNNNILVLYVDGILENTQTFTNAISFNNQFCLGSSRFATGVTNYYGYLSNFRLVIGTAVYNGASFSVPTSPLTAISGTQLLMNTTFDENFLVDSSPNQIEFTMVDSVVSSDNNPFNSV